jgi:dipeptidyl aminopeptidase/acylaminoacyl peptidase
MRAHVVRALFPLCALVIAAASASAAEEAPLLPLSAFFANARASGDYRVSPDGGKLAWIAMSGGRATLHFRRLEETAAKTVETPREMRPPWPGGQTFWWSRDGKHILFLMDRNGDENAHLFSVDVEATEPLARDLTPFEGVRVEYVRALNDDPNAVMIAHTGRTGLMFDLYRLNLATGTLTMFAENPGNVCGWSTWQPNRLRLRIRCFADASWTAEVPDGVGGWRELMRGGYGDHVRILGYPQNPRYAWALSNRGRKRLALVRIDLRNGNEDLLYEHPTVDLDGGRVLENGAASFVWAWPGFKQWRFYDAFLEADLTPYLARDRSALRFISEDRQRRWMTFAVESDRGEDTIYLLDRATRETKVLAEGPLAAFREQLAPMEPVTFAARDGLTVHGLLTVPLGTSGPRPMVLLVHGGPWAHDHWGFDPTVQFLANRGYAVLQVNYRGSTGYGRDFMLAGTREFARKMHDDLIDGVRWAIDRGVADPKRIAIMGASYGGYSALSGAAFTPDVFVAAVDRVGISDMVSLIEDWPKYWRVGEMGFWSRFFGDPSKPEERNMLAERSPLNHADAIRAPLLVVQGANDVRVRRDHSDRIVAALRARSHDVEYLLFPEEGHGINLTRNRIAFMRATERFLARHLGGRDGGDALAPDAAEAPAPPGAR